MLLNLLLVLALSAVLLPQSSARTDDDFLAMTPDQIKNGIEKRHPAAYYILAGKLFEAGARDEAVFWFYAGQLRYRFHLGANPKLDPSGDPALFGSLAEVVGRPLNQYAFGDLTQLNATLDKVLAWDEQTDNGFTSKTAHATLWQDIRGGLVKLREYIEANAETIRADRKKNGLENRKP
jgi:hypothetical protein